MCMKIDITRLYSAFIFPNKFFLALVFGFFIFSFTAYLTLGNLFIHHHINTLVGGFGDWFFLNITEFGNGIVVFILLPFLLFKNPDVAVRLILAFLLSTLIVWLFKFVLFDDASRPMKVFADANIALKTNKGIKMYFNNTFPSGHATTIFTILSCISFSVRKNGLKLLCFVVALIIGFSRVYLSQHFLHDVASGALIGTFCSLVVFYWQRNKHYSWKIIRTKILHSKEGMVNNNPQYE